MHRTLHDRSLARAFSRTPALPDAAVLIRWSVGDWVDHFAAEDRSRFLWLRALDGWNPTTAALESAWRSIHAADREAQRAFLLPEHIDDASLASLLSAAGEPASVENASHALDVDRVVSLARSFGREVNSWETAPPYLHYGYSLLTAAALGLHLGAILSEALGCSAPWRARKLLARHQIFLAGVLLETHGAMELQGMLTELHRTVGTLAILDRLEPQFPNPCRGRTLLPAL